MTRRKKIAYKTKEDRHANYIKNREKQLEQTRQRYLADPEKYKQYQREYREKNRVLLNQRTRNRRLERLKEAIELLGGYCQRCKNSFDPVCYDFHHINPEEKDFTIGENMLLAKDKIMSEVKKCILLCSNCHRLTHKELQDAS